MARKVQCAGCQAWLQLPEGAPARVRCPKCKGVIETANAVEAGPSAIKPPPPAPPKPIAKAAPSKPAEVDDLEVVKKKDDRGSGRRSAPDRDDEDDRPPSRRSRRDEDDDLPPSQRKSRRRDDDYEEDEDDRPRKKKSRRDEDDEDEGGGPIGDDVMARGQELSVALADLPEALRNQIKSTINKREEIVYIGQPVPKLKAWRAAPVGCFGGVFSIGALVFILVGLGSGPGGPGIAFVLLPLVFLAIGVGMMLAPLLSMKNAKNTAYVLTTRRALVFEKVLIFGAKFTQYSRGQASNAKKQHSWMVKGAGDLVMREELHITHHHNKRGYSHTSTQLVQYGFMAIAEVDLVEELLLDVLAN